MITSPPDLRPETRARQRAELTAIVAHETTSKPRQRLVPLLAAAAVLAVTAGLAIGVPALRHKAEPPAAGTSEAARQTAVTPLTEADKTRLAKICYDRTRLPLRTQESPRYLVLDGFRFTNAPADAYTPTWVVIKALGLWTTCGIDANDAVQQVERQGANQDLYRAIEPRMIGAGAYAAHIKRITVTVGDQQPVEAVMRNGYFYTATPYIRLRGPQPDSVRRVYVVRGYDATGKLVYTSPKTNGEVRALSNTCYLNPDGKLVVWQSDNPHPDLKTCRQGYLWNYG